MSGFVRRFTQDPGISEITSIEGVIIIDREPPGSIRGASTGVVIDVGEFEDGDFNVPSEVSTSTDLLNRFGAFGFSYDGVVSQNPCARARKADGAVAPEYWNGNGFISLVNKRFSRLIVVRVDTTVGEVEFMRNACVKGAQAFTYGLVSGQGVEFLIDNVDGLNSPAIINSVVGVYPTTFVGGIATPVAFLLANQSQAQVIARINTVLGAAIASDAGGGVIRLTSPTAGPLSSLEITAVSGVLVTTALGIAVTPVVNGTLNSDAAVFTGLPAARASSAGVYPTTFTGGETMRVVVDKDTANQIGPVDVVFLASDQTQAQVISRINSALGYAGAVNSGAGVTTINGRLGGTAGSVVIESLGGLVATATGFSAGTTAGTGNVADISQVTFNEIKTVIEAAVTGSRVEQGPDGSIRVCSTGVLATSYIEVVAQTATALGFVVGDRNAITDGDATKIPAGTRVTNNTTTWVTAKTVNVLAGNFGPYKVRIRPALDDGTAVGGTVGTVTKMVSPVGGDAFSVTNTLPVAVALTEPAIDAAYVAAIDSTLNSNAVSRNGGLIVSARQSNAIRGALRTNAFRASSEGLAGRVAIVRPPLGTTTRAQALSTTSQPGVGAYREQRVVYAFPGTATFVPQIAARGLSGGAGFTADGIIDTGFDSWVASTCSQLAPEENPGQLTGFMAGIISVERGNPDVQDMRENDYKAFRAGGIAALRMDDGIAIIQSGITSVEPSVQPNLVNIARRRMADYIQDSIAPRLKAFNKKLNTRQRRALIVGEIGAFLNGLVSKTNPSSQRIDSYSDDAISGNTPESIAAGIFRIIIKVRTLSSMDFIVLDTEIGENVVTVVERADA
jgi:hypothetical protein